MKKVKYIIVSLALALFIAGCAGSSGMSNLDHFDSDRLYYPTEEGTN